MGDNTIVIGGRHLVFGIIIIGFIVGFVFLGRASSEGDNVTGNYVKENGEKQHVKVSMKGNQYIFEPPSVKKGIPVRMEVDRNSVFGCYRDIVIPQLGVRKFISQKDNIMEFTPTIKGVMKASCSMGMGFGSFTVT